MSEHDIQNNIRLALGRIPGLVLWRNQNGGTQVNGRWQKYGLCKGASDLIGIYATIIGPEHVGTIIGRFVAGEIKADHGKLSLEQKLFLDLVHSRGGLAGVWRSVDDAKRTLGLI